MRTEQNEHCSMIKWRRRVTWFRARGVGRKGSERESASNQPRTLSSFCFICASFSATRRNKLYEKLHFPRHEASLFPGRIVKNYKTFKRAPMNEELSYEFSPTRSTTGNLCKEKKKMKAFYAQLRTALPTGK